jgi:hypothetical protein
MSSRRSDEDQVFIVKPYQALVFREIIKVQDARNRGAHDVALDIFIQAVDIAPKPVRNKMKKGIEELKEAQQKAKRTRAIGVYAQNNERNRQLGEVSSTMLGPLLNKFIDILDKRGYIERDLLISGRKRSKRITTQMFEK